MQADQEKELKAKEEAEAALAEELHREEVLRRKLHEEQVSKFQDVGYVSVLALVEPICSPYFVLFKFLCKILYDTLDATMILPFYYSCHQH